MKKFIIAMLFIGSISANFADDGKHLFILSGQSNMVGMDPNVTFIPAVEKEFGKENVIVVHDAKSGMPIASWYNKDGGEKKKRGGLYKRLMRKVNEAIKGKKLASVTFVWMQGERDAREKRGNIYAENFKALLGLIKKDLKLKDLNFVIGRLSDYDMKNQKYQHWTKVREVQMAVADADPRGAWINTDDLNDGKSKKGKNLKNDLHYSKQGYDDLGTRFAEKAIELIKKNQ